MVRGDLLQNDEQSAKEPARTELVSASPRVSIGVPVYNGERYLAAALDALLAQTFADFEIIISDNGSTDGTEDICHKYADRDGRVRYVRAAENRGLAWNFNRVVELAQGTYFKWAAYDDLCAATYIERCVEILDQHPDVVWCHSCTCYIDAAGQRMPDSPTLSFLRQSVVKPAERSAAQSEAWTRTATSPHQRFHAVMTGPGEVYDMYGLIRLSALRRTGLHRPFYGADGVLVAELSLAGRFAEVPEELFFARRHAEQTVFGPVAKIERDTSGARQPFRFVPRRLRRAGWMLRLALQAELGMTERLRCLAAWGLFIVNPKKWRRLAIDGLRAVGFRVAVPEDAVRKAAFSSTPNSHSRP